MAYASAAAVDKLFESFLELYRDNDGWEFVTEKRGVSVERKYFGDDGVATLRGVGTVAASWRSVMDLLTKPERRQEWDLFYETGHHVKRFDENTGLGYVKTKSYTMVWPRDFSVLASGRLLPDDAGFIFTGHSVVDDELIPADSSCVRGTVHIAGFHVVPVAGNPSESIITYIFKIDAAGWVPSSLSNMVNTYQPLSIIGIRKVLTGSPAHPPGSDQ